MQQVVIGHHAVDEASEGGGDESGNLKYWFADEYLKFSLRA